jgi:hypothetical protein
VGKRYNSEQIAIDLLLCKSNADVCKKNDISEATLYRLKKDNNFKEILDKQRKALFSETMQKAQAYSLAAVEVLHEISTDKSAPQGSRVSASVKIIELGQNAYDHEQIIDRINDLEKILND